MITVRIHRDADDADGVLVQLTCFPRIGESISIPDADGQERDLRVVSVNHWIKPIKGHQQQHLQQIEAVVFAKPTAED